MGEEPKVVLGSDPVKNTPIVDLLCAFDTMVRGATSFLPKKGLARKGLNQKKVVLVSYQ